MVAGGSLSETGDPNPVDMLKDAEEVELEEEDDSTQQEIVPVPDLPVPVPTPVQSPVPDPIPEPTVPVPVYLPQSHLYPHLHLPQSHLYPLNLLSRGYPDGVPGSEVRQIS